ncbi:MAG: hypothetical protein IID61_09910 [SAR324 cluster bacterium]|nr:hypothetical protein [SAR324 cluster bacterium]
MLVQFFSEKYSAKIGKNIDRIPKSVIDVLEGYHWPGNIREFENVIERAVILTSDTTLRIHDRLGFHRKKARPAEQSKSLPAIEAEMIRSALEECHWVIGGKNGAASRLGIPPSTLRERIKKYKITSKGSIPAENSSRTSFPAG